MLHREGTPGREEIQEIYNGRKGVLFVILRWVGADMVCPKSAGQYLRSGNESCSASLLSQR